MKWKKSYKTLASTHTSDRWIRWHMGKNLMVRAEGASCLAQILWEVSYEWMSEKQSVRRVKSNENVTER